MNELKFYLVEKELYYKGNIVLKYSIEYPEIINSPFEQGKISFNIENRKNALELKEFAESKLYEKAKKSNTIFEFYVTNKIICNEKYKISLIQEQNLIEAGKNYKKTTLQNSNLRLGTISVTTR